MILNSCDCTNEHFIIASVFIGVHTFNFRCGKLNWLKSIQFMFSIFKREAHILVNGKLENRPYEF